MSTVANTAARRVLLAGLTGWSLAAGEGWLGAEEAAHAAGAAQAGAIRPHVAAGVVGQPFRFALAFRNRPDRYEAEGLPPGLSIDPPSGVIAGIPTRPGTFPVNLSAVNATGRGSTRVVITVAAAASSPSRTAATQPASTSAPSPAATAPRIAHGSAADEADEPDPYQAVKDRLRPWTDNMRRTVENALLPAPTTLPAGDWYYRIVHTARQPYYRDWKTNLLGLDDNVKIGIMVGYGLAKDWDVTLQRTNGYTLQVDLGATQPTSFDYYDLMVKHKLLDQFDGAMGVGGLADVAVTAGLTDMQRNQGRSLMSLNLAVLAERLCIDDRLRLGCGLAYASMSAFEEIPNTATPTKLFPDEYDALSAAGSPPDRRDPSGTLAIPVTAVLALSAQWQLYAEAIFPVSGYRTGAGPSMVSGLRLNTNTHQYSVFLSNTGNIAFNSVISGGSARTSLPLFGFYITAFF